MHYRGIQGFTGEYRGIQGITGEYRGKQGITGVCKALSWDSWETIWWPTMNYILITEMRSCSLVYHNCTSKQLFFNEHPEGKRFFFKKLKLHSVHIISQAAQTLNTINT